MARRYHPAGLPLATSKAITDAQAALERASARLAAVEAADPSREGWADRYSEASSAYRSASRRLELLEQLKARQLERGGKRQAAVKASAADLRAAETGLVAARDQVAAAAAGALKAMAQLAEAESRFNALVAAARAKLAELGLQIVDDLVDTDEEHSEGANHRGLRIGGTDWTPLKAGGTAAYLARQVYGHYRLHPLAEAHRAFRVHDVEANGLRLPTLASVGAKPPALAQPPQVPAPLGWASSRRPGRPS